MKVPALIAAVAALLAAANPASAQTSDYLSQNRAVFRAQARHAAGNGVVAKGRCGGISYGTGARSCGTATGGPVGGIGSRN